MDQRKKGLANTITQGLQSVQHQLSSTVEHYLSAYANDLIWEDTCEFKVLPKKYTSVVERQMQGNRSLIPLETLQELTCNTYILVSGHLFYVEKARNKITEIPIDKAQLKALGQLKTKDKFIQDIERITGYQPSKESVRAIEDSDPLPVQFSKHAMLALQETTELVQNLGKLADKIAWYTQTEAPDTQTEKVPEALTQQLVKIISDATAPDLISRTLQKLPLPDADGSTEPTSLAAETGKLALDMTAAVINKIPGLGAVIKATQPFHQTLLLSFLAPLATPIALYQAYITNRWYVETTLSATKAYPTVTDFIREQRDGIWHPWQKLSSHCEALYKLAQQAKLPQEAINQLKNMQTNLAELQAKALLNPSQASALLNTNLAHFSQTLSGLMTTYFTQNPQAKLDVEEIKKSGTAKLASLAAASHKAELTHHLRFGVLLEEVRPLFYAVESVSTVSNPLGYSEKVQQELQDKLVRAEARADAVKKQQAAVTSLLTHLEWYEEHGNDLAKPDSAWRKLGFKSNKGFTITTIETLEKKITALLKNLAETKKAGLFNAQDLTAVDALEDRLLSDLTLAQQEKLLASLLKEHSLLHFSLEKKLAITIRLKKETLAKEHQNKSYSSQMLDTVTGLRKGIQESRESKLGKGWPPAELALLLGSVSQTEKDLNERLLDVAKYSEALQEHTLIRTEYAISTLRNQGLTALIEAVREGKDNPQKNLFQKRKLASLLADLGQADRETLFTQAHTIATAFITSSANIQELITAVHAIDPALAQALTIESSLAGYLEPVTAMLESKDPTVAPQALSNALDRLTPQQVFSLFEEMAAPNPSSTANQRAALLIGLLYEPLTPEITDNKHDVRVILDGYKASKGSFTKNGLIQLIMKSYENAKDNLTIKNKIGLFLERLVHADPQLANAQVNKILAEECVPIEPNQSLLQALQTLKSAREKLADGIKHLFSDHANKEFIWEEDKKTQQIKPIAKTDPLFVQLSKCSLLALQTAEETLQKADTFFIALQRNKNKLQSTAEHLPEIIGLLQELSKQLVEISALAEKSGAPAATQKQFAALKQAMLDLPQQLRSNSSIDPALLGSQLQQISDTLTDLARPYVSLKRPVAPNEPEKKYSAEKKPVLWDPTAQARDEWFPLIEPLRSVMQGSQKLHEFFDTFIQDATRQGIKLDPEQKKLIEDTSAALKHASIDEKGYYLYSNNETPFSQSLKGLFNLSWGINELSLGFSQHSGAMHSITSMAQAGTHGYALVGHFWKIQWPALGGQFGELADMMMNAMLIYGKDKTFPQMEEFSRAIHAAELQHDLRFGVLSKPIRPLLDGVEKMFHTRGLGATANPFSYDPALEKTLQEKFSLATSQKDKNAIEKYRDAIQQQQKMRQEFVIRHLQAEGIIALVEAAKQGKNAEKLNIAQKRQLAILLADVNLADRTDYLTQAHEKAAAFVEGPANMAEFIEKVTAIDRATGHSLAVEAVLAGYTQDIHPILYSEDKHTTQQDLIHALDRLEAKQVFSMQEIPTAIFLTLLREQALTPENIAATVKTIAAEKDVKKALLNSIVTRYQSMTENTPATGELRHKLGLFLGRLARAESETAKIIFADPAALAILQTECLTPPPGEKIKAEPALYYEAMVNSFDYDYVNKEHEKEDRTADAFIEANRVVILNLRKTLSLKLDDSDEAIIHSCKADPFILLEWIEKFIKEKTSADSTAEKKLSQFATAFMLCTDNQAIRQKMLDSQQKAHGSKAVKFLELLTPPASLKFWKIVRKDLLTRPKAILFVELDKQLKDLREAAAKDNRLSEAEQKQFIDTATLFIEEQKMKLTTIASPLGKGILKKLTENVYRGDLLMSAKRRLVAQNQTHITECRHAVQEMQKIQDAVNKEFQQWTTTITHQIAERAPLEEQAPLNVLDQQLAVIEKLLADYLASRPVSLLNGSLRAQKIQIVNSYVSELKILRSRIQQAYNGQEKYAAIAISAISAFDEFDKAHGQLVATKEAKQSGSTQYHIGKELRKGKGKLGKIIDEAASLFKLAPSSQPEAADSLPNKISLIAKIVAAIRAALAKYTRSVASPSAPGSPDSTSFQQPAKKMSPQKRPSLEAKEDSTPSIPTRKMRPSGLS